MHFTEARWLIFILLIVFIHGYKIIPPKPPATAPQQIHIGFGQKITDIIVLWATINNDTTIVEYHVGNKRDIKEVKGETIMFQENTLGCQYLHRVYIANLTPGTKYFYSLRGENPDIISSQYSFVIPDVSKTLTYMIYGDLGLLTANLQFLKHEVIMDPQKYSAIFHIGDIAYDLGSDGGRRGDQFLNAIQDMAARVPYMTIPGDHELFPGSKDHYRFRFSTPNAGWPMPLNQLWYSIDAGLIHFVCLSTEVFFHDKDNIDRQNRWLEEDLKKANENRDKNPWIVALGHRPLYCSVDDKNEDCRKTDSLVRENLEDLFHKYGVDIYISGHQHLYERTYPVYKNKVLAYNNVNPKATIQLTVGSFGNQYLTEFSSKPGGPWSANVISAMEMEIYGKITAANKTHLYWCANKAMDNGIIDKAWIIQNQHGPFQQVFIPNPLGKMGEHWKKHQDGDDNTFINLNFFYVDKDDYYTRITVLMFTFFFLIFGVCFRKKILNSFRYCCINHEKCKNGQLIPM